MQNRRQQPWEAKQNDRARFAGIRGGFSSGGGPSSHHRELDHHILQDGDSSATAKDGLSTLQLASDLAAMGYFAASLDHFSLYWFLDGQDNLCSRHFCGRSLL